MYRVIAEKIMDEAKVSLENGQNKYRAYLKQTWFELYRAGVDQYLTSKGYAACIVTE